MRSAIEVIKAALAVTAEGESTTNTPMTGTPVIEDAPLLPYEEKKIKPKNLDLSEYSLKPVGDLRRAKPIMDQLSATTAKIKKLDEGFANMKSELDQKIMAIKQKEGYQETQIQLKTLTDRGAQEVQRELNEITDSYGESKKILLEYQERVYAIYNELKEVKVSDKERLELLQQSMTKLLAPELIKSVNALVDTGVRQMETAKSEIHQKFVSWEPSKTLRKDVKEELPKKLESLVTAGPLDAIKNFLSGLWETIKGLFEPIKDNAVELQSLLESEVAPIIDATKPVLAAIYRCQ